MIGYLEDIKFNVSDKQILTFKDFSHSSSAKLHNHEIIGNKPLTEFIGCELDKITFTIELNALYGVEISDILDKLCTYEQSGTPLNLVIGEEVFGTDMWVIESTSRAYNQVYQNGVCTQVNVDLNLSEFISNSELQPNKKKKSFKNKKAENVDKSKLAGDYKECGVDDSMNPMLNTITA